MTVPCSIGSPRPGIRTSATMRVAIRAPYSLSTRRRGVCSPARGAGEQVGVPVWFEPDAAIQVARCRIVRLVDDLDSSCADVGEPVDAGGGTSVPVLVSGGRPRCASVRRDRWPSRGRARTARTRRPCVLVVNHEVEVGAVERCLSESLLESVWLRSALAMWCGPSSSRRDSTTGSAPGGTDLGAGIGG